MKLMKLNVHVKYKIFLLTYFISMRPWEVLDDPLLAEY